MIKPCKKLIGKTAYMKVNCSGIPAKIRVIILSFSSNLVTCRAISSCPVCGRLFRDKIDSYFSKITL